MAINYEQHTWGYGEELTPDKFNNIEGGVKANADAINALNSNLSFTNYVNSISKATEFSKFNDNYQQAIRYSFSTNSKLAILNLTFFINKSMTNPDFTVFTLPKELKPSKNVVLIAFVDKKPAYAYIRGYNGAVQFSYAGTITTSSECNILGMYDLT